MTMTTTKPAQGEDTRTPAEQITELCARHGQEALGRALIAHGATVVQAKDEILEALCRNDHATGGHFNTRQLTPSPQTEKDLIENTLAARMGVRGAGPTIKAISCVGLATRTIFEGSSTWKLVTLWPHPRSDPSSHDQRRPGRLRRPAEQVRPVRRAL